MADARRITVSTFGVIATLAGIEHGVGEVLQGSVPAEGVVFLSWPDSPFFAILGGEPAMSLIPNLLITGILAILASLAMLVWIVTRARSRHFVAGIVLLAIAMLLVGAGFGPPLLCLMLAVAATKIGSPLSWWRNRAPARLRTTLAALWPWLYGAAIVAWLWLMPGTNIAGYYLDVDAMSTVPVAMALAFGLLLLALVASIGCDACRLTKQPQPARRLARRRGPR